MIKPRKFEILDTTLREGEQCFGVFFPIEIKKQIVLLLDRIGVDFIEVGHPAAAPSIEQAASEIASMNPRSRLIGHARLNNDEIQLVDDLGLRWVGLFCGINKYAERKYSLSKNEIFKKAADTVHFAKQLGLSVKFACEDASRTEADDLVFFYRHLLSLGVDRLSFADTVGQSRPADIRSICSRLKEELPDIPIHFHFHDDSGLAAKNASVAVDQRAACLDASIMGIGERIGILRLEEVLALSRDKGYVDDDSYREKRNLAMEAATLVKACTNPEHFALRRFAHKAGVHINGVVKDAAFYESTESEQVGESRILVLSKLIGKSGLRELLQRNGFQTDGEMLSALFSRVKGDEGLELFDSNDIRKYFQKNGAREILPA